MCLAKLQRHSQSVKSLPGTLTRSPLPCRPSSWPDHVQDWQCLWVIEQQARCSTSLHRPAAEVAGSREAAVCKTKHGSGAAVDRRAYGFLPRLTCLTSASADKVSIAYAFPPAPSFQLAFPIQLDMIMVCLFKRCPAGHSGRSSASLSSTSDSTSVRAFIPIGLAVRSSKLC